MRQHSLRDSMGHPLHGAMRSAHSASIYDSAVKQQGLGESHHKLLALVGHNQRVLEVGPAGGYMTEILAEGLGCTVDCVEIDPAATLASKFSRRLIVGSIEAQETLDALDTDYDVAIFGDVLEHLIDPAATLRAVRDKLNPSGRVLASIPNIAHWTVRLALLGGRFEYASTGLLDETHLRFFTVQTARRLFEEAGYRGIEMDVTRGPLPLDGAIPHEGFKRWLVHQFPGLLGFQFIIEARKA